jgi:hypothetical protein
MHHAFGNALAVKMSHLLEKQEVFKYNRPARTYGKRILIVAHGTARIRRHDLLFLVCHDSPQFGNSDRRAALLP